MITTHINMFDGSIIAIMVLSCVFAFYRGFVREVLSLFAWVGAGLVALYYFPVVAAKLAPHFKNAAVAGGIGALGLYIGALIVFSILNAMIFKFVKEGSDVGMLDNTLGLAFGALRGAFIVSLTFILIKFSLPENQYPDWLKQSFTRPYAEKGAKFLISVAPGYIQDLSSLEKKMADKANARASDSNDDTAAHSDATSELDRAISSPKDSE